MNTNHKQQVNTPSLKQLLVHVFDRLRIMYRVEGYKTPNKRRVYDIKARLFERVRDIFQEATGPLKDPLRDIRALLQDNQFKNPAGIMERVECVLNNKKTPELERAMMSPEIDVVKSLMAVHSVGMKRAFVLLKKGVKAPGEILTNKKVIPTRLERLVVPHLKTLQAKIPRKDIKAFLAEHIEPLRTSDKKWASIMAVGSYRRGSKFSGDIDLVIRRCKDSTLKEFITLLRRSLKASGDLLVLSAGEKKAMLIAPVAGKMRRVDLRMAEKADYHSTTLYFTGPRELNIAMRLEALKNGWRLNEYGLFKGDEPVQVRSERAIFEALGIQYIPPQKRDSSTVVLQE